MSYPALAGESIVYATRGQTGPATVVRHPFAGSTSVLATLVSGAPPSELSIEPSATPLGWSALVWDLSASLTYVVAAPFGSPAQRATGCRPGGLATSGAQVLISSRCGVAVSDFQLRARAHVPVPARRGRIAGRFLSWVRYNRRKQSTEIVVARDGPQDVRRRILVAPFSTTGVEPNGYDLGPDGSVALVVRREGLDIKAPGYRVVFFPADGRRVQHLRLPTSRGYRVRLRGRRLGYLRELADGRAEVGVVRLDSGMTVRLSRDVATPETADRGFDFDGRRLSFRSRAVPTDVRIVTL
ncbi:hypothetical protein [Conexibacter sp. SYSU D00693]|uniref:hypothetical protein n=1 Tax=Conexibacter sp. SYSU D00693 TaxID=2812560 RepID=UPI00196B668C|nr:hypothetical protein [Conexibacter sp. SYSU D00693]